MPSADLIPVRYRIQDGQTDWNHFTYVQEYQQRDGRMLWVVERTSGDVLSKSKECFTWQMQPSSRTDEFIRDTRFESAEEACATYLALVRKERQEEGAAEEGKKI